MAAQPTKGLIRHLTRQVGFVVRQVVDVHEIPGQVKDGLLDNHSLISNLDQFRDSIEGAERGNPDSLPTEKKGRVEG